MQQATLEDVERGAFDTTVYWAGERLPEFSRRFDALKSTNPQLTQEVEPYFKHLLAWDQKITADSTAATLCEAWYGELYGNSYPAETLLAKYVEHPELEFTALVHAAGRLAKVHGDWRVPWGKVFRSQRRQQVVDFRDMPFSDGDYSLPSLAGPGPMGVIFTQYSSPSLRIPFFATVKNRYGLIGATYLAVYEFGDRIRGRSVHNFGSSGDPLSPHYFDQAELLSKRQMKPELFYWDDVKAGSAMVYHPGQRPKK